MVDAVKGVRGAEDVLTPKNEGVQYYRVDIDRLAAGRMGLSVDDIGATLRTLLEGRVLGLVLEQGRRTPLLVRGPDALRGSPALFAGLTLALPDGNSVPLSAVAKLEPVDGPVKVDRENAQRMVVVQANVRGRDLVGFVEEAQARVAEQVKLPEGYRTAWGGQFENQQRAAARLAAVVPLALGLIFALLFATFGSVRQAVLVFANIPFALIGGVFALWLSGEYLSVPASVGFVALLGIAVLNGLVMVSYFISALFAWDGAGEGGGRGGRAPAAPGAHDREHRRLRTGAIVSSNTRNGSAASPSRRWKARAGRCACRVWWRRSRARRAGYRSRRCSTVRTPVRWWRICAASCRIPRSPTGFLRSSNSGGWDEHWAMDTSRAARCLAFCGRCGCRARPAWTRSSAARAFPRLASLTARPCT
jgi:hypothetical protein